jgi:uncharacterized protein (TIGR02588 family)
VAPAPKQHGAKAPPLLEWIAGAVSLAMVGTMLALLAWHAITTDGAAPELSARVEQIVRSQRGYTVRIIVENDSAATAAQVQVEGVLRERGEEVRSSTMVVDFVPGRSRRRGGLLFDLDPREHELSVRVVGYGEP